VLSPPGKGPAAVRVFANALGLDFDAASSRLATQELALSPADVEAGAVQPLRFVLFQKVQDLSLFFPKSFSDDDVTEISCLKLFGDIVPNEGAAWAQQDAEPK
jgi:hypothetical protein